MYLRCRDTAGFKGLALFLHEARRPAEVNVSVCRDAEFLPGIAAGAAYAAATQGIAVQRAGVEDLERGTRQTGDIGLDLGHERKALTVARYMDEAHLTLALRLGKGFEHGGHRRNADACGDQDHGIIAFLEIEVAERGRNFDDIAFMEIVMQMVGHGTLGRTFGAFALHRDTDLFAAFSMQSFYTTLQKPEDNLCIKYEVTVYKMLSLMMPFQTIECVIKIPLDEQEFIFEYNKRYQTFKNINKVEVNELYDMFTAFNPLFTIHRRFSKILGVVHDMNIKEAFDGNNQKYQRVESELSKKYDINYFNKITKFKKNSTFISTRIWSRMNKEDDQERFEGNMVTIDIEKTNYITIRIQRVFRRIFD